MKAIERAAVRLKLVSGVEPQHIADRNTRPGMTCLVSSRCIKSDSEFDSTRINCMHLQCMAPLVAELPAQSEQ